MNPLIKMFLSSRLSLFLINHINLNSKMAQVHNVVCLFFFSSSSFEIRCALSFLFLLPLDYHHHHCTSCYNIWLISKSHNLAISFSLTQILKVPTKKAATDRTGQLQAHNRYVNNLNKIAYTQH